MVKGKKGKGSKGKRTPKDTERASFTFIYRASLVTGVSTANLNATGLATVCTRFLTQADSWAYFRYTSFKYRMHCVNANQMACCFFPVVDTAPTTLQELMEQPNGLFMGGDQTVPSDWKEVPASDLRGPINYYRTIDGTFDSTEEFPARFIIVGLTATDPFAIEIHFSVEFKESVAPFNSPLDTSALWANRERRVAELKAKQLKVLEKEMSILATKSVAVAPPVVAQTPQLPSTCIPTCM